MKSRIKAAASNIKSLQQQRDTILGRINPDLTAEAAGRIRAEADAATERPLRESRAALARLLDEARATRAQLGNPLAVLLKAARKSLAESTPGVAVLADAIKSLRDDALGLALPCVETSPLLLLTLRAEAARRGDPLLTSEADKSALRQFAPKDEIVALVEAEVEGLDFLASNEPNPGRRLGLGHELEGLRKILAKPDPSAVVAALAETDPLARLEAGHAAAENAA